MLNSSYGMKSLHYDTSMRQTYSEHQNIADSIS